MTLIPPCGYVESKVRSISVTSQKEEKYVQQNKESVTDRAAGAGSVRVKR
jgi:hypothetical protein